MSSVRSFDSESNKNGYYLLPFSRRLVNMNTTPLITNKQQEFVDVKPSDSKQDIIIADKRMDYTYNCNCNYIKYKYAHLDIYDEDNHNHSNNDDRITIEDQKTLKMDHKSDKHVNITTKYSHLDVFEDDDDDDDDDATTKNYFDGFQKFLWEHQGTLEPEHFNCF